MNFFNIFSSNKKSNSLDMDIDALHVAYQAQVTDYYEQEKELELLKKKSADMEAKLDTKELEESVSRRLLKEYSDNEKQREDKLKEMTEKYDILIKQIGDLSQRLQNEQLEKKSYEKLAKMLATTSVTHDTSPNCNSNNAEQILKELCERLTLKNENYNKLKKDHSVASSGKLNSSAESKITKKNPKKSQHTTQYLMKGAEKKGDKSFDKFNQNKEKQKESGHAYPQGRGIPPIFSNQQNHMERHEQPSGFSGPYQQPPSEFSGPYQQPPSGFSGPYQQPSSGFSGPYQQAPSGFSGPYQQPPSGFSDAYQQPPAGFSGAYQQPPAGFSGPYQQPPSGFNGPYQQPPSGFSGPYQQPPSGFNGPYQQSPSGFNGPPQSNSSGFNGPKCPPFPPNNPPFGKNNSFQNQKRDATWMRHNNNLKEFQNDVKGCRKENKKGDAFFQERNGKGGKDYDASKEKGKTENFKKNIDSGARGNQNIKGDLFIAKNLWSKLEDLKEKKKNHEDVNSSELERLIMEMQCCKIIDKKVFLEEIAEIAKCVEMSKTDNNSNESESDEENFQDTASSLPNNFNRRGRGRGRGRGNYQRQFKQHEYNEDDDSDKRSFTSERSYTSRRGGRPYKNRGRAYKTDTDNVSNKSDDDDSDQRSVTSEGTRTERKPFQNERGRFNKSRGNHCRTRRNNGIKNSRDSKKEDEAEIDSGEYASEEIMQTFVGRSIPSLTEALKNKIEVTLKVKGFIMIGPNEGTTVQDEPSTLLDIILFKSKYPLAVCVPKNL